MSPSLSFPRALTATALALAAVATSAVAVFTVTAAPAAAATAAPGPSNTGVPAGITLRRIDGDVSLDRAGATYTNLDIHGRVRVNAPNITLANSIVRGSAVKIRGSLVDCTYIKTDHHNFTLRDSTLAPTYKSAYNQAGIQGYGFTVIRADISGTTDAVAVIGGNVTVQSSWLHDTNFVRAAQNPFHKDTHNDGVQISSGSNITITGNTISGNRNSGMMVAQDQGAVSGVRFTGNWSNGGGCNVNVTPTPRTSMSTITVSGNRFGRAMSVPNCAILQNTGVPISHTGNVWADNGKAVSLTRGR